MRLLARLGSAIHSNRYLGLHLRLVQVTGDDGF